MTEQNYEEMKELQMFEMKTWILFSWGETEAFYLIYLFLQSFFLFFLQIFSKAAGCQNYYGVCHQRYVET